MSETLTIKRESLPVRCEVCHQTDQFNPATGVCRRCSPMMGGPPESNERADVFDLFDIPEKFHEALFTAVGEEGIWWVGFPVKKHARQSYILAWFCLVVVFSSLFAALFWDGLWVVGVALGIFWGLIFGSFANWNNQRLDATMYILTETRAITARADIPAKWREFRLNEKKLRTQLSNAAGDLGHVILQEETRLGGRYNLMGAWDEIQTPGFFTSTYAMGFFFIENPHAVEWIIRHRVLGYSPFGQVEPGMPQEQGGPT